MGTMKHELELEDGRKFIALVGTITRTELGLEDDHRCFWGLVEMAFGGSHQAYCPILSGPRDNTTIVHRHVNAVLNAVGVRIWEQLPGKKVMALYDPTEGVHSTIVGISSLDGSNVYLHNDLRSIDEMEASLGHPMA